MDSNSLTLFLQEVVGAALHEQYGTEEVQILPNGDLALLLVDGALVRIKMEVEVSPPSQEAKTEIM